MKTMETTGHKFGDTEVHLEGLTTREERLLVMGLGYSMPWHQAIPWEKVKKVENLRITVGPDQTFFRAVYEGKRYPRPDDRAPGETFGMSVAIDAFPEGLAEYLREQGHVKAAKPGFEVPDIVSIRSPWRPRVGPFDDDDTDARLAAEFVRLDLHNQSRDAVFNKRTLELHVECFQSAQNYEDRAPRLSPGGLACSDDRGPFKLHRGGIIERPGSFPRPSKPRRKFNLMLKRVDIIDLPKTPEERMYDQLKEEFRDVFEAIRGDALRRRPGGLC